MDKKLQVFVSSTYTDLILERQAAVEAILTAGHIPAGMELFAAGDESQMEAIKRWIEESDVYLLILGGRYGSIDQHSGRSYTEVEYDYAILINKPFFACVVREDAQEERIKQYGSNVIERANPALLTSFRQKVTSKMCRFWTDTKDIKLSILETLSKFARREELVGWVRGDKPANAATLAEEVARLAKENTELRQQLLFLTNTDKRKNDSEYALALNWDEKTRFRGFDLSKRDLSNLKFVKADFINATLSDAILENVNLSEADLTRANLEGANLRAAQLQGAHLRAADLQKAQLQGAQLRAADLQGAQLQGAHLRAADLQKAQLQGAHFRAADLQGAHLQGAHLRGAIYNSETRWPDGFDYEAATVHP